MSNIIKKIRDDKKEYRQYMARVALLPQDYQFVLDKIQNYMWSFAGGDGLDMLNTQYQLIELFEAGATEGKHVLEVTGKDVASFCDALICDNKLWTDRYRKKLNQSIKKKS